MKNREYLFVEHKSKILVYVKAPDRVEAWLKYTEIRATHPEYPEVSAVDLYERKERKAHV